MTNPRYGCIAQFIEKKWGSFEPHFSPHYEEYYIFFIFFIG